MMNKFNTILLITLFIFILTTVTAIAEMVSVKGDRVNLRSGPGTKYKIQWEYGNDFPLKVVSKQGDWVKVTDFENDTGWIHSSLLHYSPKVIVKVNRNTENKINIRQAPGTDAKIVGKAYYGVVFKSLSRKSGWVEVEHESGLKGWIKGTLLWGY